MDDEDFALALKLSEEWKNEDSNSTSSIYKHQKNLSIVDPSWELIDPIPDIRELFVQFNMAYFDGMLAGVEVKWSTRMTLCAGLCCYEGRGGLCSIKLSQPLLKLRPRKDLVETLLHEMIHALLFVTDNNKDHDGHGPEFHKHMYRINKGTGTNISVYHSFHDEVNEYRRHWWRCDGPCVKRPPFFGIVRRAMNRAPSPRDTWWNDHQRKCGGKFTKIKEPEKIEKKSNSKQSENNKSKLSENNKSKPKTIDENQSITNWFPKKDVDSNNSSKITSQTNGKGSTRISNSKGSSTITTSSTKNNSNENDIYQSSSANSSGNIYGFKMSANNKAPPAAVASFSGEGRKISEGKDRLCNRNNFLAKVENNMKRKDTSKQHNKDLTSKKSNVVHGKNTTTINKGSFVPTKRPKVESDSDQDDKIGSLNIVNKKIKKSETNDVIHIIDDNAGGDTPLLSECLVDCPACPAKIPEHKLNAHLDVCLL